MPPHVGCCRWSAGDRAVTGGVTVPAGRGGVAWCVLGGLELPVVADEQDGRAPAAPDGVVLDQPSAARLYDYYLGGYANFEVDRSYARRFAAEFPLLAPVALTNRRWLGRVVQAALAAGIRQFLDLGSGIPTVGSVHQVIAGTPEVDERAARVVYVDYEPVAVTHSQTLLGQDDAEQWAGAVQADYRDPEAVYGHAITRRLLDLDRPVCVTMASVLQFVGDGDRPDVFIRRYLEPLAAGSWLAANQPTVDDAPPAGAAEIRTLFDSYRQAGTPAWLRGRGEFTAWFDGLTLLEPGVVHATDWRPDGQPQIVEQDARPYYWSAVGEKP